MPSDAFGFRQACLERPGRMTSRARSRGRLSQQCPASHAELKVLHGGTPRGMAQDVTKAACCG